MPTVRRLENLPEDVLLYILCCCTPLSVLFLGSTCSTLHRIANTIPVKKTLVGYVGKECIPNIPPHVTLNDLSTPNLCKLLLKAERGYLLWQSGADVTPAKEHRIPLDVDASDPIVNGGMFGHFRLKILPGGDYVMYQSRLGLLQCRQVSTGEVISSYPLPSDIFSVTDPIKLDSFFPSLVRKEDEKLYLVVLALISCTVGGTTQRSLKIYETDVATKSSYSIFSMSFDQEYVRGSVRYVIMWNDLIGVAIQARLIFIDTKTKNTMIISDFVVENTRILGDYLFGLSYAFGSIDIAVLEYKKIKSILAANATSGNVRTGYRIEDVTTILESIPCPSHHFIMSASLCVYQDRWTRGDPQFSLYIVAAYFHQIPIFHNGTPVSRGINLEAAYEFRLSISEATGGKSAIQLTLERAGVPSAILQPRYMPDISQSGRLLSIIPSDPGSPLVNYALLNVHGMLEIQTADNLQNKIVKVRGKSSSLPRLEEYSGALASVIEDGSNYFLDVKIYD